LAHAQAIEAAPSTETPLPAQPTAPALLPSSAVPDPALAMRVEHMNEWLATLSRLDRRSQRTAAAFTLAAGAVGAAVGVWFASDREPSHDSVDRGAAIALVELAAAIELTSGVYQLTWAQSRGELRYARWRALPSVDALTLAHFEGELEAEAAIGRQYRLEAAVGGVGLALGGAGLLALTPFFGGVVSILAYALGGAQVAVGVWRAITQFTGESGAERALRLYREGRSPEHMTAEITVVPWLARGAVGLRIASRL
jgi:hypothetical protein